ncbi:MAG: electron transport complex subunit E [Candidatus Woesearchaeota archaeon]
MTDSRLKVFWKGLFSQNPTFVIVLGMCPTLATTISLENALGMGIATLFVLVISNVLISSMRNFVPSNVRIPLFVVIIATSVTVISLLMQGYAPSLYDSLGIYVPLIVVNCIIMARAEAFAYKNGVLNSLVDGLGMGSGFVCALALIGSIRELLGTSQIVLLGHTIVQTHSPAAGMLLLAPGGYLVMGLLLFSFKSVARH